MIELLLSILGIYLLIGIVFAVPFAMWGSSKVDPAAVKGTWGFRVLIIPGSAALWPLLLPRWLSGKHPTEHSMHRRAAASSMMKRT
jgi:hypothetical protein